MMTDLRTNPSFHNSSGTVSLRSTSAGTVAVRSAASRSRILASPICALLVCRHGVGEQQVVDLLFQPRGAAVLAGNLIDIDDLGLDAAGMRRQQQNAVADLDRFRNRMGNEQDGKFRLG